MNYRKFIIKLFIFLLCFFAADFVVGKIIEKKYFSQTSGQLYRSNYAIRETHAGLLIFGSSRATHHYNTGVFKDSTSLSYYNAGRDGEGIFYNSALLKAVVKRYNPAQIIFDINRDELEYNTKSYDRISSLLPYYRSEPEMKGIILLKSPYEPLKLISRIYPYNSMLFTVLAGNASFNRQRQTDQQGYVPLPEGNNNFLTKKLKEVNLGNPRDGMIDSVKLRLFEDFVITCKNSAISLTVITSPYLCSGPLASHSLVAADSVCRKYGVPFLNLSYISQLSDNPALFSDDVHLDEEGSIAFSRDLFKYLKH